MICRMEGANVRPAYNGGKQMTRRPIWLRSEGSDIVVLVDEGNGWREVIRTHRHGEIFHIWEDLDTSQERTDD